MEEEAGKIKEGLFCPAWTWASEKQGTIRKFYGKDMCFQKTLLLAERMDWRKQNGITSMFPSCFVGLSGLKSRILFFGLFRLNLYVPIMIRKVFNTKSNSRGCTKSTSLAHLTVLCLVTQLCPTLCDPMNCTPPGCSVHGILQARILKWAAMPSSRGSSQPRD